MIENIPPGLVTSSLSITFGVGFNARRSFRPASPQSLSPGESEPQENKQ